MECGVVVVVASSIALTKEGLVTPDHERAPVVDEHHDYLYVVELQKSLERRSSGRTRKTPASYTSPSPRQAKISRDLFPSLRGN
ncbi:uncharacterized protein LOC131041026 [Cryptomeria japonica]|uniref:uncharacterized protein LOC131041026 n=1 Tax=Cryptomeria japonica TaxID=3369 RepID=UPI0027D9DBE1|nr:uncharacterized protein LOC131041026 [Cryptomeria japonica]